MCLYSYHFPLRVVVVTLANNRIFHLVKISLQLFICDYKGLTVQAGFRKSRGTRDQIANIRWIIEKAREFQKNIYFCLTDYTKAFDYVDHNKLCKEMGIPDHLNCLLRNL